MRQYVTTSLFHGRQVKRFKKYVTASPDTGRQGRDKVMRHDIIILCRRQVRVEEIRHSITRLQAIG